MARLTNAWQAEGRAGRLTRETRASLMGVSVPTSERIVKNAGVDRLTLVQAFSNLGLEWSESYCEYVLETIPSVASEVAALVGSNPDLPATRTRRRFIRRPVLGALALLTIPVIARPVWSKIDELRSDARVHDLERRFSENLRVGEQEFNRGEYEASQGHIDTAVVTARNLLNIRGLSLSLRLQGDLATVHGDFQRALSHYQEALRLRGDLLDAEHRPALLEAIAVVETHTHHYADARAHLRDALAGYREMDDIGGQAMVERDLGTVYSEQGSLDSAEHYYKTAYARLPDKTHDLAFDILARGALVESARGQQRRALEHLHRCLEHWQTKGHPRWIATTKKQLGIVELRLGDRGTATRYLSQACTTFLRLGDADGQRQCSRELAKVKSASQNRKF